MAAGIKLITNNKRVRDAWPRGRNQRPGRSSALCSDEGIRETRALLVDADEALPSLAVVVALSPGFFSSDTTPATPFVGLLSMGKTASTASFNERPSVGAR